MRDSVFLLSLNNVLKMAVKKCKQMAAGVQAANVEYKAKAVSLKRCPEQVPYCTEQGIQSHRR